MTKKVVISDRSSKDTRGLPISMDPHKFYEYSSQLRHEQADGLEGFLHKLLPRSLFASLAFAIDPFARFKVALGRISPKVRTRTHQIASVLDGRKLKYHRDVWTEDTRYGPPSGHKEDSLTTYAVQPLLKTITKDTTRRLRVIGSDQGEFSSWKAHAVSPPQSVRRLWTDDSYYSGSGGYYYRTHDDQIFSWIGPTARITQLTVDSLMNAEESIASSLMAKHSMSMYKGILPSARTYTLFRNIVELRDIPRSILQLRDTLVHLDRSFDVRNIPHNVRRIVTSVNTSLRDVPKEWLSYSFGWRQTYSDLMGLLASPQKIGNRINFLIKRGNKPTTFRSKRNFESSSTASSGFVYDVTLPERGATSEHLVSRKTELRMVVNATIPFPPIDVPGLMRREFLRKMGTTPTFTDLYNLVPWTWLVDWFTGLGNYVDIIDTIASDNSLINWGVITAETQGKLTTRHQTYVESTAHRSYNGIGYTDTTKVLYPHTSDLYFTSHLRKDVSQILDVGIATDPSTLNSFQQSILGALLSTRIVFRR